MAYCLSATTTIKHCRTMSASEYIVISYHHHSLTFQQLLIMMAQPLTPLAVGHRIWLQDVDKCLEDHWCLSRPSSCATRSHMVTSVPLSEFPVSHISNYTRNPRTEVDAMSLSEVTAYGRSHTERLLPPCVL